MQVLEQGADEDDMYSLGLCLARLASIIREVNINHLDIYAKLDQLIACLANETSCVPQVSPHALLFLSL